MSTKLIISKEIQKNIGLSQKDSKRVLNRFLHLIKKNSSKNKVKLSRFGTFFFNKTKQRLGRNPKTKESYIIKPRKKLNFRGSNILKKFLNP